MRPEIWSSSHDVPAVSPGILRGVSGLTEFWYVLIMAPHPKHVIPPLAWDYRMDSPGIRFCGNSSGDTNLRLNIVCWHHPYHHVSSWNLCTVAISKENLWVCVYSVYIYIEKAVSWQRSGAISGIWSRLNNHHGLWRQVKYIESQKHHGLTSNRYLRWHWNSDTSYDRKILGKL